MTTAALLDVRDLVVAAKGGRRVVDGISFAVAPGEVLAIVGESGSGKTATARSLIGLLPPGLKVAGGTALFQGEDVLRLSPDRLRRIRGPGIGMVFQEPMTSLTPALTIGAQLTEGLALDGSKTVLGMGEHGLSMVRQNVLGMLRRVGIVDPERRLAAYPHEFSGGMRQRIMLASVMLRRPKLLLADEPTTALDTLTQAEVLDLMVELTRENGTAVVLVTHNLGLVARYAHRAVVMRSGSIVEQGIAKSLLATPKHSYTRDLVDALPRRSALISLEKKAEPLIVAERVRVEFEGRRRFFARGPGTRAVDDVDLTVHAGESVALVGGSGSGKTTLGRAMLRLVDVAGGRILFRGQDVTGASGSALVPFRLACQIVFQDPYSSLDPRMRVADLVGEALRLGPVLTSAEKEKKINGMLADVGLGDFARRFPHELSGGQRQRVAIARALVRDPAFVVADEPVSALDMTIQKQVLTLLRRLQKARGFACLFISHDLAAVEEISDRVVVMQSGKIVEEGSRDAIFDAPRHEYTKALLAATPRIEALVAG